MTKTFLFFCFIICCLISCQSIKPVQSSKEAKNDISDYLIEVRSVNPSLVNSEIAMLLGNKATISRLDHGNSIYDFAGQYYVQIVCKDLTPTELQNVLVTLGKCQGILEIVHHPF